jgi:hypothetical protein
MDWLYEAWLLPDVPLLAPIRLLEVGLAVASYPQYPRPLVIAMSVPVLSVSAPIGDVNQRAMAIMGSMAAWYFTESYVAWYLGGAAGKTLWQWRGGVPDKTSSDTSSREAMTGYM